MTWYDSTWNYRKIITISNSGSELTDYQVLATIDTASLVTATKMRSDCGDIRFVDSNDSTLLNYWIESGQNSSSTKIWIKIPFIPTSKTIYMYYGKLSATYDNSTGGTNTFDFFDDFDSDTGKFSKIRVNATYSGGIVTVVGTVGATNRVFRSNSTFGINYILESEASMTTINDPAFGFVDEVSNAVIIYPGTTNFVVYSTYNYPNNQGSVSTGISASGYKRITIKRTPTQVIAIIDGVSTILTPSTVNTNSLGVGYRQGYYDGSNDTANIKWVGVRKYSATEPTLSTIGSEEIPAGSLRITSTPSGAGIYIALHNQTPLWTNVYTPDPVTGISPGFYDIRLTRSGYTDWTFGNAEIIANTETQISATMSTVASITATSMTITPSETPCITGICTVTIVIRWSNSGGTNGSISPNITIDSVLQTAHASRNVIADSYIDETFIVSGLPPGSHSICPNPN